MGERRVAPVSTPFEYGCKKGARTPLGSYRFVIGLEPNLALLEQETSVAILDLFGNGATWVLLRVPASRTNRVRACFRGISHVYETEEEARRVWQIFGRPL